MLRPGGGLRHEIQIRRRGQRQPGPLDQHEADIAPPHQMLRTRGTGRQVGQIAHDLAERLGFASVRGSGNGRLHHRRSLKGPLFARSRCGQNHPVSAAPIGTAPIATAQGVKMLPMNIAVTARAATNGQNDGPALFCRYSGVASITDVTSTSRRSSAIPSITALGRSLHIGVRLRTTGV